MKKVLVLVAAMLFVAANAMAFSSVVLSKHNMQTNAALDVGATDEVCVFCHTPHGADISNPNAPLWNRSLTHNPTVFYNSATLDQANSRPGIVSASVLASDAPLCLSCHDGNAVTEPLVNPPNSGTPTWTGFAWTGGGNLGTDLSNDHPIGMNYVAVQAADLTGFNAGPALTFYDGNKMWCSSCHDVHSDSNYPFLAASNAASALCLTCHNK